jgi:hypothetical protein
MNAMAPTRFLAVLLTGLLITITATSCRKTTIRSFTAATGPDTLIPGAVINSAGSWSASSSEGSTKFDVSVSGTSINWTITTEEKIGDYGSSGGSSSSAISLSSPSDPWFVFVESPSRLWMFNGKDELAYRFKNDGGGSGGGQSIFAGKLLSGSPPVPRELVLQLPPDLQKLFPHVEPAGKRPSL